MELGTYKFSKQPNQYTTRYQRAKHAMKVFMLKLIRLLGGLTALAICITLIFIAGQYSTPEHLTAQTVTLQDVTEFPVLQRIAGCESEGNRNSKGSQFDSKGRLRMNVNKDGTVDIGKNMINSYFWELKAIALGYNIYTEQGNDAMAKWIYLNKGTGDWSASAKCWK